MSSYNKNNGHYLSECFVHFMMRHNFISKQFWEPCDGGGGSENGTDPVHHSGFDLTALI